MKEETRTKIVRVFPWVVLFVWVGTAEWYRPLTDPQIVRTYIKNEVLPIVRGIDQKIDSHAHENSEQHNTQVEELKKDFAEKLAAKEKEVATEIANLRKSTIEVLRNPEHPTHKYLTQFLTKVANRWDRN